MYNNTIGAFLPERKVSRVSCLECLDNKALSFKKRGYDVKADLSDYSRPSKIQGLVPDLRAKRGEKIIIGKIVTEENIELNRIRWQKLVNHAAKNENVSFRLYLASENGQSSLLHIFE
jgi:hypothetical protein